jgi:hypothetical protein
MPGPTPRHDGNATRCYCTKASQHERGANVAFTSRSVAHISGAVRANLSQRTDGFRSAKLVLRDASLVGGRGGRDARTGT